MLENILQTPKGERVVIKEFGVKLPELENLWKKELKEIQLLEWKEINGEWFAETSTLKAKIIKTNKYKKYRQFEKYGNYILIYYLKEASKYKFRFISSHLEFIKQKFKKDMISLFSKDISEL
jgi:hypothetical protein